MRSEHNSCLPLLWGGRGTEVAPARPLSPALTPNQLSAVAGRDREGELSPLPPTHHAASPNLLAQVLGGGSGQAHMAGGLCSLLCLGLLIATAQSHIWFSAASETGVEGDGGMEPHCHVDLACPPLPQRPSQKARESPRSRQAPLPHPPT